jgi:hypothetical protein
MPENVKQLEYLDAKQLAASGAPSRVFIMAAMLTDDDEAQRLCNAYPGLHAETMRRRWDSTDGALLGDEQDTDHVPPMEALGRDD